MPSGHVANTQTRFRVAAEGDTTVSDQFSKVLLSLILPFMAVYYATSGSMRSVLINLVLCLFLYLPGILHALYTVLKAPEDPNNGGGDDPNNGGGDSPNNGGGDDPNNGGGDNPNNNPDNGGGNNP